MLPLELLINALVYSNLLVLMSIGLTLTYITLKTPNFAHGDFVAIGAYVAYTLYRLFGVNPYASLIFAFIVAGLVAMLAYLLVFKRLTEIGAGVATLMIAYLAMESIFFCAINIYAQTMTSYTGFYFVGFLIHDVYVNILNATIPLFPIFSTILTVGLIVVLYIFLAKTRFGVAMRASIENPNLARTLGMNVELIYAISWLLAGGLTGIAGALIPVVMPANPYIGWVFLLRIFAATVLGGLSSIWGAIVGGYIAGLSEIIGIYVLSGPPLYVPLVYRSAIPFLILLIMILVAPKGLTAVNWANIFRRLKLRRVMNDSGHS